MRIKNNDELVQSLKEILDYLTKTPVAPVNDFDELKKLLNSSEWPEAVPEYLICGDKDEEKSDRAFVVIDMICDTEIGSIKGKKVLDFGCGEGHTTIAAENAGAVAIGYDIKKDGKLDWETGKLTTDWKKVTGPFDVIILHDVLDHCENPVKALQQIKTVATANTRLFCRCHPWPGPHSIHQYKKLNKAYVHLVFSEEELKKLNVNSDIVQKVKFPIDQTDKWFSEAGFKTIKHIGHTVEVSNFFKTNTLVKKQLSNIPEYKGKIPEWQMSQVFNDYILAIK